MAKILLDRDNMDQVNEYLAQRAAHRAAAEMAGQWLGLFVMVIGVLTDLFISRDFFPDYAGYPFVGGIILGFLIRKLSAVHTGVTKL